MQNSRGLLGVKPRGREGGNGGGGCRHWPQLLSVNKKLSDVASETGNSRRKDEEQTLNRSLRPGKLMAVAGKFLQTWPWSGGGLFSRGG